MKRFFIGNILFFVCRALFCSIAVYADVVRADAVSFDRVEINYPHDECSFNYSPVDFCDKKHLDAYDLALRTQSVNFDHYYILLTIKEWRDSSERSIIVIDQRTGVVYPLPIDSFSAPLNEGGRAGGRAKLNFSKYSNDLCINGSILVYRSSQSGKFCFKFEENKFVGYHTAYMGHDQP